MTNKKTKWVKGSEFTTKTEVYPDTYYCPFCENEAYWDTDYGQQLFDYCPYCGEHMKGDDHDR